MLNSTGNRPLTEPHFDDERTLLSAKPVVPLEAVAAHSRKRIWLLTATITVAVALGTLSAAFLYYKWTPSASAYTSFANSVQAGATGTTEPLPEQLDVASAPEQGVTSDSEAAETPDVTAKDTTVKDSKKPAKAVAEKRPMTKSPGLQTEPSDNDIRLPAEYDEPRSRRVERWEERRARRAARRNRNRSNDDLMRIDQIFEGTPRP